MCVWVFGCVWVCAGVCVYVSVCMCLCVCVSACVHVWVCIANGRGAREQWRGSVPAPVVCQYAGASSAWPWPWPWAARGGTYGAWARPPSRQPRIPELLAGQSSSSSRRRAPDGGGCLHWSPRKSPRDIFSTFLFLGAAPSVSRGSRILRPYRAGQKSRRTARCLPCRRGAYP